MPRVAATPTPIATARTSRMTIDDMRLPNQVEPNSSPEASAWQREHACFHGRARPAEADACAYAVTRK
jgi:hypothetical protein